jgi:hypothetical protein
LAFLYQSPILRPRLPAAPDRFFDLGHLLALPVQPKALGTLWFTRCAGSENPYSGMPMAIAGIATPL